MSTCNRRCIIAVLALALSSLSGQAQDQANTPQNESSAREGAATTQVLPIPIQIVENDEEAEARQRREAETRQREIDDLIAQQEMNEATQAMNEATQRLTLYSLISTVLVAAGTGAIIWTLFLARQANKFAFDAVKVTEKIGEISTRAWLTTGAPLLQGSSPNGQFVDTYLLVYPWINTGPTPAKEVHLYMGVSTKEDLDLTLALEKLSFAEEIYNVHPRSPGPSAMIDLSLQEIMNSLKVPISVRLVARYQTVESDDDKYAEACFNFRYTGPPEIGFLQSGRLDLAHFHVTPAKTEVILT